MRSTNEIIKELAFTVIPQIAVPPAKVLVTGADGLIGMLMVETFCRSGWEVDAICGPNSPPHSMLPCDWPNVSFYQHDFSERVGSLLHAGDYDYIIHAAGYGQPVVFSQNPSATVRINTEVLDALLDTMKTSARLLYLSTSEVYSGAPQPWSENTIGQTMPDHPRAIYIESKRMGEALCYSYRARGRNAKVARVCSVFGPGVKLTDTRAINKFIKIAVNGGTIHLMDQGNALRSYLHVRDAVVMLLNILFRGKQPVYNVGGESVVSIANLAKTIVDKAGNSGIFIPDEKSKGLEGAPPISKVESSRYHEEFPGLKTFTFDEGLDQTIEWYRALTS